MGKRRGILENHRALASVERVMHVCEQRGVLDASEEAEIYPLLVACAGKVFEETGSIEAAQAEVYAAADEAGLSLGNAEWEAIEAQVKLGKQLTYQFFERYFTAHVQAQRGDTVTFEYAALKERLFLLIHPYLEAVEDKDACDEAVMAKLFLDALGQLLADVGEQKAGINAFSKEGNQLELFAYSFARAMGQLYDSHASRAA